MIYSKDIEKEIKQVSSLKDLTEVYGEIASIRMKIIRDYVLKNRYFLSSIEKVFKDALAYYQNKIAASGKKGKEGEKVTFLAHNGRTVAVLISANTGFYGNVVREVFEKFIDEIRKEDVEVTIIGRLGRTLFLERLPNKPYTYFELPDYGIDKERLTDAIKHLVQYEEIRVYYGKYYSVISQKPTTFSISAGKPIGKDENAKLVTYIFEPSVEEILMFFETQIFASLFDQSIRESQLAKFASRILSMDRASDNIEDKLKELNLENLKISHRIANKKQLNSLASAVY
ncbi:F0F1 ATP synthase subunit gamma [Patescibacteria group bacterium]